MRKHVGIICLFILLSFSPFRSCPSWALSWGPLGVLLGASWGAPWSSIPPYLVVFLSFSLLPFLGLFWGPSWRPLRGLLGRALEVYSSLSCCVSLFFALALLGPFLGASWGPLGVLLGSSWGPLGALLGLSWRPLGSPGGPLGAILEAVDQRRGGPRCSPPPRRPRSS